MSVYAPKTPSKLNAFNAFLVGGGLVLGCLGWWFLPHFYAVFQETGIMRGTCYEAYREVDNERLLTKLLADSRRTGLILTRDNFQLEREPYPPGKLTGKTESQREILEKRGYKFHVRMIYVANAQWPLTEKFSKITFRRTQSTELETITW